MFRKIVSNLPFSPALVGQLGFYAKRLRKEKTTRRLGLIFVALALVVQSLAVFQPTESANAVDNNVIVTENQLTSNNIVKSITATNASQGFIDAASVTAGASDQISYTITIDNTGDDSILTKLEEPLSDILNYATLIDNGGGTFNKTTEVLSWPDVTLAPSTEQTRTFVVRLLDTIPATAKGTNGNKSYDCTMTNTFGNSINISVDCPTLKVVEKVVSELPIIGTTENIIFAIIVLSITSYFYIRTRQLEKEIHLIRKDISAGTI